MLGQWLVYCAPLTLVVQSGDDNRISGHYCAHAPSLTDIVRLQCVPPSEMLVRNVSAASKVDTTVIRPMTTT